MNSVTAPLITIGLPVFNAERFLADALDSILEQTYRGFKLVVSDNGSTDATAKIVDAYTARDRRIEFIRNDYNRGASWNFNRVFAECDTAYFKWAAADDLLAPTLLDHSLEVFNNSPDSVVLVYPKTLLIDSAGKTSGVVEDRLAAPVGAPPHVRLLQIYRHMEYGNAAFSLLRSDALRRTRLLGNFPSADHVLMAELALAGEFRELPEPLFLRRIHEGMSIRANTSSETLTHWFDPQRAPVKRRQLTLFQEHLRGVRCARLSARERALVYLFYTAAWTGTRLHESVRLRTRLRTVWSHIKRTANRRTIRSSEQRPG
jgi:glycosyltransferase involved in cell wall biosynthesis